MWKAIKVNKRNKTKSHLAMKIHSATTLIQILAFGNAMYVCCCFFIIFDWLYLWVEFHQPFQSSWLRVVRVQCAFAYLCICIGEWTTFVKFSFTVHCDDTWLVSHTNVNTYTPNFCLSFRHQHFSIFFLPLNTL